MANATIHVDVVSAEEAIYSGEAEFVVLPGEAGELGIYPRHTPLITRIKPGAAGEIGVLARHAPLVATLKAGSVRIYETRAGSPREFATGPGFFKVELDRAIALVDDAVLADEIDEARARKQLEEARAELERVERGDSSADRWQLEQRIRHAENQLAVAGGPDLDRVRPKASAGPEHV